MPSAELLKYIEATRAKGTADETIKTHLINSGWDEGEVNQALSPQNNNPELPPPVPHFGMWVAFQYIILFITLYISFTALAGILHHGVDQLFPDNLDRTTGLSSYLFKDDFWLKSNIAGIVVAYPIFAVLFLLLKKQALEKPVIKNLRARKVLIYITLVGTFLIMTGHLISTIYGFLGGSATFRSLAHLVVTFLVAGTVFAYLMFEVKDDRKAQW